MCAYYGWLKHADAKNLLYKIQSLTGVRYSNWNGKAYYTDSRDKTLFTLYIDLIIFLLILKSLNMIGVFMLKIEKKKLNLKHNIL